MSDVTISQSDLWLLSICTLRYAMGRSSYVVGTTIDFLRAHAKHLEPEQREQILREVTEELDRSERHGRALGDAMDHKAWKRFLEEGLPS